MIEGGLWVIDRDAQNISANDVVGVLWEFIRESERSGQQGSLFSFASKLTGIPANELFDEIYQDYTLDLNKVVFRDFDDDGLPVEFFFDYEVSQKQREDFVFGLGYLGDTCERVSLYLSLASLDDVVVEALLKFNDGDERRVELDYDRGIVDAFIGVMGRAENERGRDALLAFEAFVDDCLGDVCNGSDRAINREKLKQYLEDEMILEFPSADDCMDYFNSYDHQNFQSVSEMKRFQGMFGFGLDGKWYHISYREAVDVWEPLSFAEKLNEAMQRSRQLCVNEGFGIKDRER